MWDIHPRTRGRRIDPPSLVWRLVLPLRLDMKPPSGVERGGNRGDRGNCDRRDQRRKRSGENGEDASYLSAVSLMLAATGLVAWSSSGASATSQASAASSGTCQAPSTWRSTKATPVSGIPSDFDVTSFDGTKIRIHWFPDPSAGGRAVRLC